jgi:hypothetical protein
MLGTVQGLLALGGIRLGGGGGGGGTGAASGLESKDVVLMFLRCSFLLRRDRLTCLLRGDLSCMCSVLVRRVALPVWTQSPQSPNCFLPQPHRRAPPPSQTCIRNPYPLLTVAIHSRGPLHPREGFPPPPLPRGHLMRPHLQPRVGSVQLLLPITSTQTSYPSQRPNRITVNLGPSPPLPFPPTCSRA